MNQCITRMHKCATLSPLLLHNVHRSIQSSVILAAPSLEQFTIHLSKEKSQKWKSIQKQNKEKSRNALLNLKDWKAGFAKITDVFTNLQLSKVDIRQLSPEDIDCKLNEVLANKNIPHVSYLTEQCIQHNYCPSLDIMFKLLSIFSMRGNIDTVESLSNLCCLNLSQDFEENFQLKHFKAQAIWMKGDIEKAVDMFTELYFSNKHSRPSLRFLMKFLINDTISNRSEASVVTLTKKLEMFSKTCNDWGLFSFLWEYCWLSEWFGDQQLASKIFNEHEPLRTHIQEKLPALCTTILNLHNDEDSVLRLLQLLLQNDMKFFYIRVLECLFLYRYHREDILGCHQIVKSCIPLNVKLRSDLQTKYLMLLVSRGYPIGTLRKPVQQSVPKTIKYKF